MNAILVEKTKYYLTPIELQNYSFGVIIFHPEKIYNGIVVFRCHDTLIGFKELDQVMSPLWWDHLVNLTFHVRPLNKGDQITITI